MPRPLVDPRALAGALAAVALLGASPLSAQFTPRRGPDSTQRLPPSTPPGTPSGATRRPATRPATTPAAPRDTSGKPVVLEGVVYDSLAAAPLVGATIQVVNEADRAQALAATSDSAGRWRIPNVRPGRYLVGFFHPSTDILGIELPLHLVDLPPGGLPDPVELGTPSPRDLFAALCKRPAGDSTGALFGLVRDANTGDAISGAKVVITWSELMILGNAIRRQPRRIPIQTTNGSYLACGLPIDADVVVSAESKGWTGGQIEVRAPARRIARRDISLADSAAAVITTVVDSGAPPRKVARGTARLTGIVKAPDGRPLNGAQVLVHGTDVVGRTDAKGEFSLSGLPAGTYSVEARAIGFLPRRGAVDLASGRAASVSLRMEERGQVLNPTVVQAQRNRTSRDLDEFAERSKRGLGGYFITAEQMATRSPFVLSDALRGTPSVRIIPTGQLGNAIMGRNNCPVAIYLDGMPVSDGATTIDNLVRPQDVAGIEIYGGGAIVPARFQSASGGSGCGVVVIWTKR